MILSLLLYDTLQAPLRCDKMDETDVQSLRIPILLLLLLFDKEVKAVTRDGVHNIMSLNPKQLIKRELMMVHLVNSCMVYYLLY